MKKVEKAVIISVFVSLTAHSLFFASSKFIIMPGMFQVMREARGIFRLREVKEETASVELFEKARPEVPSIKMTRKDALVDSLALQEMISEERFPEDVSVGTKKEMISEEAFEEMLPEKEEFDAGNAVEAEARKTREEAAPKTRSLADVLASESAVAYSTGDARYRETDIMREEPADIGLPGTVKDAWRPGEAGVFRPGEKEVSELEGRKQEGEYEDISRFLDFKLYTYTDPGTGEKYFKLFISAEKPGQLEVVPKEMIFLIDSSKSITEEKLFYIKEAVIESLGGLNKGDRFNVVAFRGDLVNFREKPVYATTRNIDEAKPFIRELEAIGQTDVGNALLGIIERPVAFYPSYIMLITDGRPTTGVVDSRLIIQEITRANRMVRPIFSFGGGARVNRYLLDFISYQNRAWSRIAGTTHDIKGVFGDLYGQIKDPVLLNVRYRMIGLDPAEVYPKYLSDFYRGKPFVLYGRYGEEDVFSAQLLGEVGGATKEFIFKASLKAAEKGTEEIAREWAFMKVYYLISRITMARGDENLLREEIDRLSRKYGITTPYDLEDED